MADKEVKDVEEQALGVFVKSYAKRYEQWKKEDLLPIAIQTLPKQVKLDRIFRNLERFWLQRERSLSEEV
jgi:hypothetical protein